jgi:hypothetical protein
MKQKQLAAKKASEHDIEPRTARAAICALAVDAYAHGEGSGMFDVYSASGNTYTVSLSDPLGCTCPDFAQRGDQLGDAGCYHIRRVRMAIGIDPIPEELESEVDGTLATNREKFGADPAPEPITASVEETKPARAVATDGGQVLEPETRGSDAETALPKIVECVEPPEQGGARFIRCEGCGEEVIGTDESRLVHREGCAHAVGADHTLPAREASR